MKEISTRCGKGVCIWYDKTSPSKCYMYSDRKLCSISNRQLRKAKYNSKKRSEAEIKY